MEVTDRFTGTVTAMILDGVELGLVIREPTLHLQLVPAIALVVREMITGEDDTAGPAEEEPVYLPPDSLFLAEHHAFRQDLRLDGYAVETTAVLQPQAGQLMKARTTMTRQFTREWQRFEKAGARLSDVFAAAARDLNRGGVPLAAQLEVLRRAVNQADHTKTAAFRRLAETQLKRQAAWETQLLQAAKSSWWYANIEGIDVVGDEGAILDPLPQPTEPTGRIVIHRITETREEMLAHYRRWVAHERDKQRQ